MKLQNAAQLPPMKRGLFVGLTTLDVIYLADHAPIANEKLVATDYTVSAGGPATNAAVAFARLGNEAILLAGLGCHPLAELIRADLQACGVTLIDLLPAQADPPPVSSIVVTQATGDRAVVSINAARRLAADFPAAALHNLDIVLVDGHQMQVGAAIAAQVAVPVVVDGGSWKVGFETVLAHTDYAICSANFQPPGCGDAAAVFAALSQAGISHMAITRGSQPVLYRSLTQTGEIPVPLIRAIDTLGAGDIFHGAFCHAILQTEFPAALDFAARVAAQSCQYFGSRRWRTAARPPTLTPPAG